MERFLKVKIDTDYSAVQRRVKASWGGLTSGSFVDVQIDEAGTKWVRCRIERWMNDSLLVRKA